MGRRQPDEDDEGGLDSLLDTMTNVIGILVLVLIVLQLSISDVVARITSENQIDEQKLAEMAEKLTIKIDEKEELETVLIDPLNIDPERQRQELTQKKELLARRKSLLQQKKKQQNEYSVKIEQDREMAEKNRQIIADTEAKRKELQVTLASSLDKKAELQAKLATTPKTSAPADIKVSIPNPRPAPPGAKAVRIICANERLYPIAVEMFQKNAEAKAKLIIERFRLNANPAVGIDPEVFTEHWEKLSDQDEFFEVEYYVVSNRYLRIRFLPRENKGATIRQLNSRSSTIRSANYLGAINPLEYYVSFHVLPDSYETYVLARNFFSDLDMLAGWTPEAEDWQYTASVPGGIELGPPRPKDPNPPKPRAPAKPANVID